jgi:hypothetical protein
MPNAFGLYDMSGNVYEWTYDRYQESPPAGDEPTPVVDPHGPESGSTHVFRGGSWYFYSQDCRSACRSFGTPDYYSSYFGFRLARTKLETGNTRIVVCTNTLPEKASWKEDYAGGKITQTWNGSEWLPSTDSCEWECSEGYVSNGSDCVECITGQTQFVECSTDSTKWQKQVCDESGYWQNFEGCVDYRNNVICTSQDKCYNNSGEITCPTSGDFYGQDAQYADLGYCIPKSYTVSGSSPQEIVTDNNTGLGWQRIATGGSTFPWDNAIAHCDGLTYGGYDDWRLPTRKELATLSNYGRYEPAIDIDAFPGTLASTGYWSFSLYGYSTDEAWSVYFDYGDLKGHNKTDNDYARCVRGEEWNPESIFEESTIAGEVIVTDTETGLKWTKDYVTDKTWQQAMDYCETLDYGGFTDWRLPNIEELKTLIDDSVYSPASSFPAMPPIYFWSSSSDACVTQMAWHIHFNNGELTSSAKQNQVYVRCVR